MNWKTFEDQIANIYRKLGAKVKQNINLLGFQIDIYAEEITPSGQLIKEVIECKYYNSKIGNKIVNDFGRIIDTLKSNKIIDKGVMVSKNGFSQDAYLVAEGSGIELITLEDLRHIATKKGVSNVVIPEETIQKPPEMEPVGELKEEKHFPKIFVLMPFSDDLDDTYYLGIREVALSLSLSCERADEMEFVGGIIEKIYDSIKSADLIIAEVSQQNTNVYFEIGFALALNKPVILLTKDISRSHFDISGYRHIIYKNIRDLKDKLENFLKSYVTVIR